MRARLRRASELTLLVYLARTLGAVLLAWPLFTALTRALDAPQPIPPERAAATLLLGLVAQRGPQLALELVVVLGAQAVLAPLFTVSWLHAMAGAGTTRQSLARGVRDYPRALFIALLVLFAAAVGCLALGGGLVLALPHTGSVLTEQALRGLALLGAGIGVLFLTTLYELACAELVCGERRPWSAARLALRRTGMLRLLARAGAGAVALNLLFFAEMIGRAVPLSRPELLVLMPQQLLIFASVYARAAWLASTLDGTGSRDAARA